MATSARDPALVDSANVLASTRLTAAAEQAVIQSDWLAFARTLPDTSVDLVYADPPFNTGKRQAGRAGAYEDAWETTRAWADWLRNRLLATAPKLKETGSILIHVDWRTSHHARLVLDEVFGEDRFVNHLVWAYGLGGSSPRRFARKHDDILWYCVDPDRYWFEPPQVRATSRRLRGQMKKATSVLRPGDLPPQPDSMEGECEFGDVLDVPNINNMARERTGWPTQKPLALLELLVQACCPAEGLVFDPCCGSGTSLVAAARTGRGACGCDVLAPAVELTRSRVIAAWRDAANSPPRRVDKAAALGQIPPGAPSPPQRSDAAMVD